MIILRKLQRSGKFSLFGHDVSYAEEPHEVCCEK